jgi:predicted  nucleic acid-binding Zn-ribbon protein
MEILEELRVDMYERTEEENKFRKEWDLVFAEYQRAAQKRTSLQSAYTLAVTPTEIEEMEKRLAAEIDDMEEDVQSMIGEWERLSVLLGDLESEWESFTSEEQKVLARNIEELGVRAEEVRGRTSALKSDLDAVNSEISQLKFDLAVAPAEKPEALLRRIRSASARREEIRKAIEATAIHAARIGHELETRTEEWDAAAGDEAKELFDRIPAVRRRRDEIQMTVWVAIGDVERARGVLERH